MLEEPLFDYYDMHLSGMVVSNREETDMDEPADEPEFELLET